MPMMGWNLSLYLISAGVGILGYIGCLLLELHLYTNVLTGFGGRSRNIMDIPPRDELNVVENQALDMLYLLS